jgi:hypothetical protein
MSQLPGVASDGSSLLMDFMGFLRLCLSQQAPVRQALYCGLHAVLTADIEGSAATILNFLAPQLRDYVQCQVLRLCTSVVCTACTTCVACSALFATVSPVNRKPALQQVQILHESCWWVCQSCNLQGDEADEHRFTLDITKIVKKEASSVRLKESLPELLACVMEAMSIEGENRREQGMLRQSRNCTFTSQAPCVCKLLGVT